MLHRVFRSDQKSAAWVEFVRATEVVGLPSTVRSAHSEAGLTTSPQKAQSRLRPIAIVIDESRFVVSPVD